MRATIVWSGSGVLALGCLLRCLSLDPEVRIIQLKVLNFGRNIIFDICIIVFMIVMVMISIMIKVLKCLSLDPEVRFHI